MEQEMGMKGRYKYVERLGSTVGDLLVKADPWKEHCGRKTCLPCQSAPGKCGKQGVVYSITCETCREQGLTCQYWGESARTGHDRGLEHLNDLRSRRETNALVKHWMEHHEEEGGPEPSFTMKIMKTFVSPLQRQSYEGFKIGSFKGHILMNKKGEWGNNLPPNLVMEEEVKSGSGRYRRQEKGRSQVISRGGNKSSKEVKNREGSQF